jgi:hypothetical protein
VVEQGLVGCWDDLSCWHLETFVRFLVCLDECCFCWRCTAG